MSRAMIVVKSDFDRRRAANWCQKAPDFCRIEFKQAKRTLDQNSRLWAMLTDVATQAEHCGRKYSPEVWKVLFLHGWQKEVRMIPSLDGTGVLPLTRTSDLSKDEMSELIEFMISWAAENSVTFHDAQPTAADYLQAG